MEDVHRLFQLSANRLVFVTYFVQLIDSLLTYDSDSHQSVTVFDAFLPRDHCSAKRCIEIACHQSVCLYVRLSVTLVDCDHVH